MAALADISFWLYVIVKVLSLIIPIFKCGLI